MGGSVNLTNIITETQTNRRTQFASKLSDDLTPWCIVEFDGWSWIFRTYPTWAFVSESGSVNLSLNVKQDNYDYKLNVNKNVNLSLYMGDGGCNSSIFRSSKNREIQCLAHRLGKLQLSIYLRLS